VWGRLAEDRAQRIFTVLRDWVNAAGDQPPGHHEPQQQQGRCFFKSTTSGANSFRDRYFETELHTIRPHALKAGCGYLDFAYLTQDFGALDYESSLKDPRAERRSVFVDQVRAAHFPVLVFVVSVHDRFILDRLRTYTRTGWISHHPSLPPSLFSGARSTSSRGCTRS
jgi:hypothetical protein